MSLWDDLLQGPRRRYDDDSSASVIRRQYEAGLGAKKEIFDAKLKEFFLAGLPDTSGAELLRAIVESDDWFVPIQPDNSFDMVEIEPGKHRLAIELDKSSAKRSKKKKQGKGGRLLPLYTQAPERPAVRLDGRAIVRALPENLDGLLIPLPNRAPRELGREYFAELLSLADAFDLEEILLVPGPDQIEGLKCATWWVETSKGALLSSTLMDDGRVVPVYTHRDRVGYGSKEVIAMKGEQLFRLVAESADVDGVVVNRTSKLGRGENILNALALSPGFACRLLEGEDIRPGARPLPARNVEEVELWLQMRSFPWEGRELVEAPFPEGPLWRAVVPQGSQWRMQETLGQQMTLPGPTWSPVFVLPPINEQREISASELADGPTRILCAGLLAKELGADAYNGADAERYWRVGRGLLFGRLVDEFDRKRSHRRLVIATELAKLLPHGADRIPRSAILTVEGATLLREYPHGGSRAWIEATIQQAERYTQRWVWL